MELSCHICSSLHFPAYAGQGLFYHWEVKGHVGGLGGGLLSPGSTAAPPLMSHCLNFSLSGTLLAVNQENKELFFFVPLERGMNKCYTMFTQTGVQFCGACSSPSFKNKIWGFWGICLIYSTYPVSHGIFIDLNIITCSQRSTSASLQTCACVHGCIFWIIKANWSVYVNICL